MKGRSGRRAWPRCRRPLPRPPPLRRSWPWQTARLPPGTNPRLPVSSRSLTEPSPAPGRFLGGPPAGTIERKSRSFSVSLARVTRTEREREREREREAPYLAELEVAVGKRDVQVALVTIAASYGGNLWLEEPPLSLSPGLLVVRRRGFCRCVSDAAGGRLARRARCRCPRADRERDDREGEARLQVARAPGARLGYDSGRRRRAIRGEVSRAALFPRGSPFPP